MDAFTAASMQRHIRSEVWEAGPRRDQDTHVLRCWTRRLGLRVALQRSEIPSSHILSHLGASPVSCGRGGERECDNQWAPIACGVS